MSRVNAFYLVLGVSICIGIGVVGLRGHNTMSVQTYIVNPVKDEHGIWRSFILRFDGPSWDNLANIKDGVRVTLTTEVLKARVAKVAEQTIVNFCSDARCCPFAYHFGAPVINPDKSVDLLGSCDATLRREPPPEPWI